MGIPISEKIPDCATTPRNGMHMKVRNCESGIEENTLIINMDVGFHFPFEWIEVNIIVGGNKNETRDCKK